MSVLHCMNYAKSVMHPIKNTENRRLGVWNMTAKLWHLLEIAESSYEKDSIPTMLKYLPGYGFDDWNWKTVVLVTNF